MTTREQVPILAKQGLTTTEIAVRLGVSQQRISQIVREDGIEIASGNKSRPKTEEARLVSLGALVKRLFDDGSDDETIAASLGIPFWLVIKVRGRNSLRRPTPPTERMVMFRQLAAQGWSNRDIAELFGEPSATTSQRAKRLGIKLVRAQNRRRGSG